MKPEVIFKDDHLVAICKPAGMVSMPAKSVSGETVQEWFESWLRENPSSVDWQNLVPADFDSQWGTPQEIFEQRGGVVHRLDKDTSGVMLLARHPAALVGLLKLFRKRAVQKTYRCLVHGKFQIEQGTFTGPIARSSKNRQRFEVAADGRAAVTEYVVEKFYPHLEYARVAASLDLPTNFKKRVKIYQGFSLVTCKPKTGRTHQIRVHLAAAQHPLVGDQLYTGKKRQQLDTVWCARQFLHAVSLEFVHPMTNQALILESEVSEDLKKTLSFLEE